MKTLSFTFLMSALFTLPVIASQAPSNSEVNAMLEHQLKAPVKPTNLNQGVTQNFADKVHAMYYLPTDCSLIKDGLSLTKEIQEEAIKANSDISKDMADKGCKASKQAPSLTPAKQHIKKVLNLLALKKILVSLKEHPAAQLEHAGCPLLKDVSGGLTLLQKELPRLISSLEYTFTQNKCG